MYLSFILASLCLLYPLPSSSTDPPFSFRSIPDINANSVNRENLYEGDILLNEGQKNILREIENDPDILDKEGGMKRKAMRGMSRRWPGGIIPYVVNETDYTAEEIEFIAKALDNGWNTKTCLKIKPFSEELIKGHDDLTEANIVKINKRSGCWAHLGFGSYRSMSLGYGCLGSGTISHEFGHILGLMHEQCRHDRDNYVTINETNVSKGKMGNFNKMPFETYGNFKIPYSFLSVMHYGSTAFAIDSNYKTIITKDPSKQDILDSGVLSFEDIKLVNLMYSCNAHCNQTAKMCRPPGYLGKDCKCVCPRCDSNCEVGPPDSECKDVSRSCYHYAKNDGCLNMEDWMRSNCAKTCMFCHTPSPPCKDYSGSCNYWASIGYCEDSSKYSGYMRGNCPLACKLCDPKYPTLGQCTYKKDFSCSNGNCIPFGERCDKINNCGDNSDEKDCPEKS